MMQQDRYTITLLRASIELVQLRRDNAALQAENDQLKAERLARYERTSTLSMFHKRQAE